MLEHKTEVKGCLGCNVCRYGKSCIQKDGFNELVPKIKAYRKNIKAVNFYQREQFIIKQEQNDENTGEIEYLMVWSK